MSARPCIAVTVGDPAGIGPEVIREALASPQLNQDFQFEVLGNLHAAPGIPTQEGSLEALNALETAVQGTFQGRFSAVVTGPIHKARMREIGFEFPGQTEFFASRWNCRNHAMLLTGGKITVALVTAHIPLHLVSQSLRTSEIVRVGKLLSAFLALRTGQAPRIAVAGLNPHAGESGLLGSEEIQTIEPALRELASEQIAAEFSGPWSPDTVFNHAVEGRFDGVLCMYHDQGLIPLKLHAFDEGVNVTLGLPFPRTSPDHGTAFEIAGKKVARSNSMLAAMNLAAELVQKQSGAPR